MNEPTKSIWRRDILPDYPFIRVPRRFLRWLFSWRGVRRILIILAWTATVIVLIYAEENWRGAHAWNRYRQAMVARGEKVDYQAFVPPPVPDDQNFASTPTLKSWFTHRTNSYEFDTDRFSRVNKTIGDFDTDRAAGSRRLLDLVAWAEAFDADRAGRLRKDEKYQSGKLDPASRAAAAPSVLAGMEDDNEIFSELREAARRPHSRYFVDYNLDDPWGILIPHLARIKAGCQRLQVKACAELALGQNEAALADVKLNLYLADSIKEEPFLVSYLVRRACVLIAIQPVWEGLVEHRWTDAQLRELQSHFQQFDFVTDVKTPLAAERAAGILTGELLAQKKYALSSIGAGSSDMNTIARIVPRGWFRFEQRTYCRLFNLQLEGTTDAEKRQIFPARVEANSRQLTQALEHRNPVTVVAIRHELLAVVLLPALGNLPLQTARAQVAADHVVAACALERYRLANGQFPENLAALTQQFIAHLPNDVIGGEPYRYQRTVDGGFTLYSVGWNERDDGGTIRVTKGHNVDWKSGDWVWDHK